MGSVVSLMSEQPSENEVRIFWDWNFAFEVPRKFRVFKQILNVENSLPTNFIHVGDTIDSNFIVTGLIKSTNYTITVGSVYFIPGTTSESTILFQTSINISTPPFLPPKAESPFIQGFSTFPKTLRQKSKIRIMWHSFEKYNRYNIRYFSKGTPPENAVQIGFVSTGINEFSFEDSFIVGNIYLVSIEGFANSVWSEWSNRIEVQMPKSIKNLRTFLGNDSIRGLRDILREFNKTSILDLLKN